MKYTKMLSLNKKVSGGGHKYFVKMLPTFTFQQLLNTIWIQEVILPMSEGDVGFTCKI